MRTRLRKKPDATSFVFATLADVSSLALQWNAPAPITTLNLELVFQDGWAGPGSTTTASLCSSSRRFSSSSTWPDRRSFVSR